MTLRRFIRLEIEKGNREFVIIPLFFGNSGALIDYVPKVVEELKEKFGAFSLDILEPLGLEDGQVNQSIVEIMEQAVQTAKSNSA